MVRVVSMGRMALGTKERISRTLVVATLALALGPAVACGGGGGGGGGAEAADTTGGATTGGATTEGSSSGGADTGTPADPMGVSRVGLRRLTRYEFDNVVRDLLLDTTRPASQLLPEDARTPFDNDYTLQIATQPLVDGIEVLAAGAAERLLEDADKRDTVVGCTPSGTTDEACMREFVARFGRLALRRALETEEVDEYVALGLDFAERGEDFYVGVEVIVRALLQDAEFVYRVELGTPVDGEPGVFQLGGYELASRLSFFLWGTTPDSALLDAAEAGELDGPDGVRQIAEGMLADGRARVHVDRFHSLWLGYAELPHPAALTQAMRTESAALVDRVVFEDQSSWLDLFTADETYIDEVLAEQYGLPAPQGGAAWVGYGDTGRMGILSHGAFLSVASNVGDTSPTKRGIYIREQLMCQPIPPPPPNVDADNPPGEGSGECKQDRYSAHAQGSCAACHEQIDPIGFGLENYDKAGKYRTHDDDNAACVIEGEGAIEGIGDFEGPAGLATLLVDNAVLEGCVTQQLYRFALGRELGDEDLALTTAAGDAFVEGGLRFDQLLVEVVAHPSFGFRREEEV